MRIAHIHTYKNFIDRSTYCYQHNNFVNTIFYLNEVEDYVGEYIGITINVVPNKKGIDTLINKCLDFDIVIAYNLDGQKAYLINRLPRRIIVIWRFFGMELYGKIKDEIYSVEEKKFFAIFPERNAYSLLMKIKIELSQRIAWGVSLKKEFQKAIGNFDYLLGLSKFEHSYLKEKFDLPKFIQHPLALFNTLDIIESKESSKILIGNNRSAFNNYLEILKILRRNQNPDVEFYVQFSYGSESKYSEEVRRQMLQIKNVKLIDDFVEYKIYESLFKSMGAFVLNGYRQMGMGAVFNALVKGLKVYLNPKNIVFNWLKTEGFLVFDINGFEEDLVNKKYNLSKAEKSINLEAYSDMSKRYSIEIFQNSILSLAR